MTVSTLRHGNGEMLRCSVECVSFHPPASDRDLSLRVQQKLQNEAYRLGVALASQTASAKVYNAILGLAQESPEPDDGRRSAFEV